MKEIWENIEGYENFYQVSTIGEIKSLKREVIRSDGKVNFISQRILKHKKIGAGYSGVALCINGKNKYLSVHRIVAIAFIPNPDNKECVNHINGIKSDNRVKNLEWCSRSENSKHAYDNKLNLPPHERGFSNNSNKATIQFNLKGEFIAEFKSVTDASNITGVYNSGISRCCNGILKQAGGYKWEYVK